MNISNIHKSLGGIKILNDISFTIEDHKILCILGPSGCGKTTTLQLLAGLSEPDSGSIKGMDKQISYAFQEPRLLPWKTVEDNLHFILKGNFNNYERKIIIDKYLTLMDLTNYRHYYPDELSGGMKQRLSLCRAFAFPHQLLLMDEPFKSLDTSLRLTLVKETAKMWAVNQNTIVFITHDLTEALLLGHKLLVYSKKPAIIKAQFTIDLPHNERNLRDKKLADIYSQLITLLD